MAKRNVKVTWQEDEDEQYQALLDFMDTVPQEESSLIAILHFTQDLMGYIPRPAMMLIAEVLGIPSSKVYGVVTFYSYFSLQPKGRYNFSVCMGTACYVKGSQDILEALQDELELEEGQTSEDGLFSIQATRCLGACADAPIVMVNDEVHGPMDPSSVRNLVRQCRAKIAAESKEDE